MKHNTNEEILSSNIVNGKLELVVRITDNTPLVFAVYPPFPPKVEIEKRTYGVNESLKVFLEKTEKAKYTPPSEESWEFSPEESGPPDNTDITGTYTFDSTDYSNL